MGLWSGLDKPAGTELDSSPGISHCYSPTPLETTGSLAGAHREVPSLRALQQHLKAGSSEGFVAKLAQCPHPGGVHTS